jgi:hypothetical protein
VTRTRFILLLFPNFQDARLMGEPMIAVSQIQRKKERWMTTFCMKKPGNNAKLVFSGLS